MTSVFFCPTTLALISTCELERCPATRVVAGLDSSKRSSTNNLSLGSCPAGRALPEHHQAVLDQAYSVSSAQHL